MTKLILIALVIFTSTTTSSQPKYNEKLYNQAVQKKAVIQIRKLFGDEFTLLDVIPAPAGTYELKVASKQNTKTTMILLADLEHIVVGHLVSPFTTVSDKSDNHQLSLLAEKNAMRLEQQKQFTDSLHTGKPFSPAQLSPFRLPESKNIFKNQNSEKQRLLIEQVKKLSTITLGEGPQEIAIFIDLECPACIKMHPYFEKLALSNEVKLHFVPVGFMSDESKAKSILSLMPTDNVQRYRKLKQFKGHKKLVDILADEKVDSTIFQTNEFKKASQNFSDNMRAFASLSIPRTPTAVNLNPEYILEEAVASPQSLEAFIQKIKTVSPVKQEAIASISMQ